MQLIIRVFTFFALAFGFTFAFSNLPSMPFAAVDIKDILCGFGPLLSGLICYKLFGTPSDYSIGGRNALLSWGIVVVSASVFMMTNLKSNFGANILFVCSQIIYCFGEEFGWRHYLQSATSKINKWAQAFIIGIVWFGWHFSWLKEPLKAMMGQNMNAPIEAVIITVVLALVFISFSLGLLMNRTQAILLPTILHFAVKTNLPTLLVTLILVIMAVVIWDKSWGIGSLKERNEV